MSDHAPIWSTCDHCGKRGYERRRDARKVAHRTRNTSGRLHAYRCPVSDLWHVGHVPALIKDGRVDRREYGGRRRP